MAEQELEKERKQLLSVFEGIDEPIYVADPETYEILFANRTLKELFGENIIGKKCYKVFQNLDMPCSFCTNDKILGKNYGKVYVWEFQNKINKRWYRCIDRAITWPDGRVVRMEIAIDITDRVKAEERVKEALEKEREFKLRTAHFFFNPLAIAKGYLQLALHEKDDIEMKIERAMKAIERVEKVVKNVTQRGEIIE
jgi:PAS domain S-box-containing protein